jgi:hypothetical protein
MRKKNEIEQKLDEKELESDLHRELNSEYSRIDVLEKFYEDRNPYVIGAMNFFSTLFFFELLFLLIRNLTNNMTLGFTVEFFSVLSPFVHVAILILCITSVIKRRSAVEVVIDRWPF